MRTTIIRMFLIGILICPLFVFLEAEENPTTASTYRVGLEYAAGRYIGIDESYGGITYFAAPGAALDNVHFLFDLKAFKMENSNWAGSAGIGMRQWDSNRSKAYGVNVFYDYRQWKKNSFNQVGFGFELLSTVWEMHLNGYLPIGRLGYRYSTTNLDSFQGGFFATVSKHQYALCGVEFNAGRRFWLGDELTAYIAPGFYYYNNKNIKNIQGIQGLAEFAWGDWVSFRLNASYDTRFKGRVQGVFFFSIPFEGLCSTICSTCESMIMGRPIRRNDAIFLKSCRSVDSNWDECGLLIQ